MPFPSNQFGLSKGFQKIGDWVIPAAVPTFVRRAAWIESFCVEGHA